MIVRSDCRLSSSSNNKTGGGSYAFNLIELLVVIVIIGILASLLLSVISRAKENAKRIQCVNNLHQFGIGLQEFVGDNHDYPLFFNVDFTNGGYPEHRRSWVDALINEGLVTKRGKNWFTEGVWHCPSAERPADYPTNAVYASYGYNAYGHWDNYHAIGLGGQNYARSGTLAPPVSESQVVIPSDMMAMGETFGGVVFSRGVNFTKSKQANLRHQGRANVVFCDGHVESPMLGFLFEDTNDAALVRWNRDHLPHR
jgi:prepilin-type processing-associated H-X9-DG protein/prepilin-type N-terminal cleavage/methylation domain-containing protein